MFDPTREEVREMFFGTWRKYRAGEPLVGIETIALQVILLHPEYHAILDHPERYRDRDYVDESNPFLHMSLHLALEEQLSIDQPPGIAGYYQSLQEKCGSKLEAQHDLMECLAEAIWQAQRHNAPLDAEAYTRCMAQKAGSA